MLTTLDDVKDLLPQVEISDQSKPTEATVSDWLGEQETLLLAIVAHLPPKVWRWQSSGTELCRPHYGPIDPDDSPLAAAILSDMVANAVAAKVLRARLAGIGDSSSSGARELQAFYDDRVKWLADPENPFDLPDAIVVDADEDCDATAGRGWFGGMRAQMGGGYRPQPKMRTRF